MEETISYYYCYLKLSITIILFFSRSSIVAVCETKAPRGNILSRHLWLKQFEFSGLKQFPIKEISGGYEKEG